MPKLSAEEIATRNLTITHPHLAAQMPPHLNTKQAHQVTAGSGYMATWQCPTLVDWPDRTRRPCGHTWTTKVAMRATAAETGCPGCAGRVATPWNRLDLNHPHLAQDWDDPRDISTVPSGSAYPAQWKCHTCSHRWTRPVEKRAIRGQGCPGCTGKVATPTRNFAVLYPHLVPDWHPDNPLPPTAYTPFSNEEVMWRCPNPVEVNGVPGTCGHEWTIRVAIRAAGNGCAGCAGKAATWWNCLENLRLDLTKQWHPTKNGTLTPRDVTPGSKVVVTWLCDATYHLPDGTEVPCLYEWPSTVDNRNRGKDCPACSGNVVTDRNRLAAHRPDLIPEWADTNDRTPDQVSVGSDYIATWQCTNQSTVDDRTVICGYRWTTRVANRGILGNDCPQCRLANASRDEIYLAHELALFVNVSHERLRLRGAARTKPWVADIVLPDQRIIVEYDGARWHEGRDEQDAAKTADLTAAGWTVIRLREAPLADVPGATCLPARSAQYKETANTLLAHLRDIVGLDLPDLDAYLQEPRLQNAKEAREHIARLLQGQLANSAKRAARAAASAATRQQQAV